MENEFYFEGSFKMGDSVILKSPIHVKTVAFREKNITRLSIASKTRGKILSVSYSLDQGSIGSHANEYKVQFSTGDIVKWVPEYCLDFLS